MCLGWRWPRAAAALLVLLLSALPVVADSSWRDRGNRFEGIRAENVRGGYFELLGLHAGPSPPRDPRAPQLHLSVPLAAEAELRVRVWEPDRSYWMVPHQSRFAPGDDFSWPRGAVLEPEGIDVQQLYVLASDPKETRYYPARLSTQPASAPVESYTFHFASGGGVSLSGMIAREEEGRLVEVEPITIEKGFGGAVELTWDGRGQDDAPVPDGTYHLRLSGIAFGKTDRRVNVSIPFIVHHDAP
jgi:hypothetical protein